MSRKVLSWWRGGLLVSWCTTLAACSGPEFYPLPPDEDEDRGTAGAGSEDLEDECVPTAPPVARENAGEWMMIPIEGAVCADGSPYSVFVRYAERSADLVITLQGGGACWDAETCQGRAGSRSAAHLDGIREDHMTALPPPLGSNPDAQPWGLLLPHLGESDPNAPTAAAHQVFFPYCTGDVFAGSTEVQYEDPVSGEAVQIQHRGHQNVLAALPWLQEQFPDVGRLLVTGCSAGGLGALINYSFFREALEPNCASLLNDSGPLWSETGPSHKLYEAVREAWQLEPLLTKLDEQLDAQEGQGAREDLLHLSLNLAQAFPRDRFLTTAFRRDLLFPLFLYDRFYEDQTDEQLYEMWDLDYEIWKERVQDFPQIGYFFPAFRPDNCSHCLSLLPLDRLQNMSYALSVLQGTADTYLGTELGEEELRFDDALQNLLSSEPLLRLDETPSAQDRMNEEGSALCR